MKAPRLDPLQGFKFIAEAISKLFQPFAEVVLHDLESNTIAWIDGPPSPRKVGQPSYLSKADRSLPPGVYGPYSKINPEGKGIKSVSIVLPFERDNGFMMCINFDVSEFQNIQSLMGMLTSFAGVQPMDDLFDENWQDKIHKFVNESLVERGLILTQLSREEKKDLVFQLRDKGAFNGKNAASYIAQILNISRASVYGYLREK